MKMPRFRAKLPGLLVLGIAFLAIPESLLCQSRTRAEARLYIRVNVVPVLQSQPPIQPRTSSGAITFDLNSQPTQFDRQSSTHQLNDESNPQSQPIVVTTVTVTPR